MLPTPLGDLSSLDLDAPEVQEQVLYYDKHQLLEGLVAENVVDQVLDNMMLRHRSLVRLETVSVVAAKRGTEEKTVFVLDQGTAPEVLHAYLTQLQLKFSVRLVRYDFDARDFVTHAGTYSNASSLDESLGDLLRAYEPNPRFPVIDPAVKNVIRQKQGFWGYLTGAYRNNMGACVVLPRLFKNFAVQPYFNAGIWDIDRVCRGDSGQLYVLEVKHKYPFGRGSLKFGINCGSAAVLRDLCTAGFCCFHSIMVKPYWEDKRSVTDLFNDLESRKHVLFCGRIFTQLELQTLLEQAPSKSPSKTSLTGSRSLDYVAFPASSLFNIGHLDSHELPGQFAKGIADRLTKRISDDELRALRMY